MNWEAIGALAEAIGVLALFISLIYLAVQVRQNTRQITSSIEATRLAAFERNIESGNRARELMLVHPELASLFLSGCRSYGDMTSEEKFRFGLMLRNIFSAIQGGYIRQLSVEHDPTGLAGIEKVVDEILRNPGVREFLQSAEPDWRPEFKVFVESRLLAAQEKQ